MSDARQPPSDDESTRAGPDASGESEQLGPYVLRRKIGEGGMGEVWLAEQREPIQRRVALKIIKPGMDSRQVVARFEAERQALAMMDHPAIARIHDAGAAPNGRPFFVMEYVQGEPITTYCDRNKLTTRQRLELLLQVCQGVQHAHQKAVIHRDLKPGNVLVTTGDDRPQPKIIDFGVAKATGQTLTEATLFTQVGMMVGTPAYMSPEQAEATGQDVDTRTDVYSLGVILYELLVGALPFDMQELRKDGYQAMVRKIREADPPRPSTRFSRADDTSTTAARHRRTEVAVLQRELAGDLDWITMKALEKDRTRRYESASSLAADIRRFLADEPVEARPPSAGYRMRKLIRRNRGAFIAAVSVFAVLLLGMAGTTYGLLRARKAEGAARAERDEARRQADIATAVNDFLNQDLLSAVQPSTRAGEGREVKMRDVLDRASERIEEAGKESGRFADKPSVEAQVRETLGLTYRALGEYEPAAKHLERALGLRERAGDPGPLAGTLHNLGLLRVWQGDYAAAEGYYRRAVAVDSAAADSAGSLASRSGLAVALREMGRLDEAEAMLEDVLERQERTLGREHGDTVITMGNLANLYQMTDRFTEAEALDRKILDFRMKQGGEDDPGTLAALNNLANVVAGAGRLAEAAGLMQRVLDGKRRILGPEHPNTLNSMNNLAEVQSMRGAWREAETLHRETLAIRARVLGERHPQTISSRSTLAFAVAMQGRYDEALTLAARSARESRAVLGADHFSTVDCEHRQAVCLLGVGRPAEAAPILRRELEWWVKENPDEPAVETQAYLGIAEARLGHRDAADSLLRSAVPGLDTWNAETPVIVRQVIAIVEAWNRAAPSADTARALETYRAVLRKAEDATAAD